MRTRIHSLESMGTIDGPGIRFIVFFQGCVMQCSYCHNRDTWDYDSGKEIELESLLNKIKLEIPFFKSSKNGGVTASGGEPLGHAPFVAKLFQHCKEQFKITTALDTSGCVELSEDVKRVLQYTDYVLIDIKHTDKVKHKQLTHRNNDLILKFNDYIKEQPHLKLWVRHVLVPGYTTDEQDVHNLSTYIASLGKNVERIDVLPYHKMGIYKWEQMGLEYPLKDVEPPTEEMIKHVKDILALHNDSKIIN